ncbi:MAG: beta-ketoacyl synthase N-terminal-like domain-containing protein, partial [Geminicoccaceae bacterium]
MTRFEPIAIIGRDCLLPGCFGPDQLWRAIEKGQSLIKAPPLGIWGVTPTEQAARPYPGGYITGFDRVFDPKRADLGKIDAACLDPVCQWPLHVALNAWEDAGAPVASPDRISVILANLAYPSRGMADYAGDIWTSGRSTIDVHNRFNAGFPAFAIARALGAAGPAFALDAACASSLYGLHLACRKLQSNKADVMLVAAVNAADNLVLHKGFEALQALSPSGRSRPFSADADGLVPAEGAAAVVLKRLGDVLPEECVFGVIRGSGLSNDGRRRSVLVPDENGQLEAMRRAYDGSRIKFEEIDYLECHATGTPVGDDIEIRSATALFGERDALPVGSLKSNLGHLITAAGLAGLLKLLSAIERETLPPTLLEGPMIDAFAGSPLYPLTTPTDWLSTKPRRAAISTFGFGGNNAHLVIEEHRSAKRAAKAVRRRSQKPVAIVICGVGLLAGEDRGKDEVARRLMSHPPKASHAFDTVVANPIWARMPPTDLGHVQTPALALLDVASEALADVALPEPERIGVVVGIGCATDGARWLLRERLAARFGLEPGTLALKEVQDQIAPTIEAADVLGAMPNMAANRINAAKDFRGQSLSIAAEGLSGPIALDLACEALRSGELDMVLVAAAEAASEPVMARALRDVGMNVPPGDMAAAIVLKREADAEKAGDVIFATIDGIDVGGAAKSTSPTTLDNVYGQAPVASVLVAAAAEATLAGRGQQVDAEGARPRLTTETSSVIDARSSFGPSGRVILRMPLVGPNPDPFRPTPHLYWARAESMSALARYVQQGGRGGRGPARIAILAPDPEVLAERRAAAAEALEQDRAPADRNVYFGQGDPDGEMAFVFTGSAAYYPKMGRGLLMAFPDVAHKIASTYPGADRLAGMLAKPDLPTRDQLAVTALISMTQTALLRDHLGIEPDAAIGLSLGESNALAAFGFWKDPNALHERIAASGMYERDIGGRFETAREAWRSDEPVTWTNWRVYAPIDEVRNALAHTPKVEITIIYSPEDCVIGGPPEACRKLAGLFPRNACLLLNQHLVVHAKAMIPFAERWRELHTWPVRTTPKIRLYSNADNKAYRPTKTGVADRLTRQAVGTVDFPATIEQAYADGVRCFVEIGPRDTLTKSIARILDDRPHLAVAMDSVQEADLAQAARTVARLFADGRGVDIKVIASALDEARKWAWRYASTAPGDLFLPTHKPPPRLPTGRSETSSARSFESEPARMPPAPPLPPPVYPSTVPSTPTASAGGDGAFSPPIERPPKGPSFSREQIEQATTGAVSALFGDAFRKQDHYERQVRLPTPPLLLVDRIIGIDAEPGVSGKGVIWTETDVRADAWYMHDGCMRPGPLIEAGQADLTLISWMGADFLNRGDRVYRLLGCDLTYHDGGLARPGDTLRYQIEITGHATLSGVRMFFFQYECRAGDRLLFSVRNGQAGFFTDDELLASRGVALTPPSAPLESDSPTLVESKRVSSKRSFTPDDLQAFRRGDAYACFGEGFEPCAAHSNPPRGPSGKLALFDEVAAFEPTGGPAGLGYLRARAQVPIDAWFYQGHFHRDPCMPGTLMAEAAVQALEVFAAAIGLGIDRDGFLFEPVPGQRFKFVCRGQVVPDTPHEISYEVFVLEIEDGDTPSIHAALLASCDGRKVFHCPRFGIRLRRAWRAERNDIPSSFIGPKKESRGDYGALLACADGAPSEAFGAFFANFDRAGRAPRLPQPPYHMMSRVLDVSTRPGSAEIGALAITEYDPPANAWYFRNNPDGAMPLPILIEIALQPNGWLGSHCGFPQRGGECFRNLDGSGRIIREIRAGDGPIRVESRLIGFSRAGPMTIVTFDVEARLADGDPVLALETVFGFFPASMLAQQAGLKITNHDRSLLEAEATPEMPLPDPALLPQGRLVMLDQVDGFDPKGGKAGLGFARGRQTVDPYAWPFRAHFYQDPVQPGSLGLEAMTQLLKRTMLLLEPDHGIAKPRFQSPILGAALTWSYRGQITPRSRLITTTLDVTAVERKDGALSVFADAS